MSSKKGDPDEGNPFSSEFLFHSLSFVGESGYDDGLSAVLAPNGDVRIIRDGIAHAATIGELFAYMKFLNKTCVLMRSHVGEELEQVFPPVPASLYFKERQVPRILLYESPGDRTFTTQPGGVLRDLEDLSGSGNPDYVLVPFGQTGKETSVPASIPEVDTEPHLRRSLFEGAEKILAPSEFLDEGIEVVHSETTVEKPEPVVTTGCRKKLASKLKSTWKRAISLSPCRKMNRLGNVERQTPMELPTRRVEFDPG